MTAPSWRRPVTVVTELPLVPVPSKPCPVCAGFRVASIDSRVVDPIRLSHTAGCRLGRAEDQTQAADHENPLGDFWRWSSAAEVELLVAYGFVHDDGALPVLAVLDPVTSELTNAVADQRYCVRTLVEFPTVGAGVRQRAFPNLTEPTI